MEVARVRAFLRRHPRVALDTCIFIYQWEANPRYSPLTNVIFSSAEQSHITVVTSTITMTELLVHPYQNSDVVRINELFGLLSTYPNLEWIAPDLDIAARAAEIRARHRLRTPDALQAATAVHAHATALVTNDPVFRRVSQLEVLILDEFSLTSNR
ncbi:MAG TPA: type II toxin-antitoxin system VapC family toxin [Candidatus Sulfotelmatobacter sp.]|nr:type II toxin-antitoxin system VapC family toxin [Candidatus Sulfotelmatobacter sp.]